MISENFLFLTPFIHLSGQIIYIISTIKGETKPNRVTWFLWAVISFIAFAAQLAEGVQWQAMLTFMAGFGPLMIFLASFVNKKAYWNVSRLDIICGAISVLAIVLWIITGTGLHAIVLALIADLLAGVPTIVKAFNFPSTENFKLFRNVTIASGITILTIQAWTFEVYSFAVYLFAINLLLYCLVRFQLGIKLKQKLAQPI